ncbi:MAG: hypothetical protein ACJ739_04330 [Acidimicrobiales bacterium]
MASKDEPTLDEVQRQLDKLAERRLLTGLTRRELAEYQALVDLEARHLARRSSSDAAARP